MKTVCVSFVSGCPRSKVDTALLFEYFRVNGWRLTNKLRSADLILLGGCGFSTFAEEKTVKFLSIAMKRKKKDAPLVVYGCLPGINPERLRKDFSAVIPMSRPDLGKLDGMIGANIKLDDVKEINTIGDSMRAANKSFTWSEKLRVTAGLSKGFPYKAYIYTYLGRGPKMLEATDSGVFNIRVARGCMEDCAYCAIKFASGKLRSKPPESVIREFRSGLSEGFKTFSLIAEDVGAYGQDIGSNIAELVREILDHDGDYRLMWTDFHPKWLTQYAPELLDAVAKHPERMAYAGFPIQSGSRNVLRSMKRSYDVGEAESVMSALKKMCPNMCLATHVLLGFPGETEEDFRETVKFVENVGFDYVEVYEYSDRPGVEAVDLPDKVSGIEKFKRVWQFGKQFRDISIIR